MMPLRALPTSWDVIVWVAALIHVALDVELCLDWQGEMAAAASEEQEAQVQEAKDAQKPPPVAKGLNFGKPPRLQPFTPRKWIWVPQYHGRLTFCERAELYHPMFQKNTYKNAIDAAAEGGEGALLDAIFKKLQAYRPGGYTCNICHKYHKPTEIHVVDVCRILADAALLLSLPAPMENGRYHFCTTFPAHCLLRARQALLTSTLLPVVQVTHHIAHHLAFVCSAYQPGKARGQGRDLAGRVDVWRGRQQCGEARIPHRSSVSGLLLCSTRAVI